jgi:uncharacterized LabA/DUF88 family protein
MTDQSPPALPPATPDIRVRAFVDFWNFQLSLKRWRDDISLDWKRFGPWLVQAAGSLALSVGQHGRIRYDGLHLYMSYNPHAPQDSKMRAWATNVLDRFPGVQVVIKERKPKDPPKCPQCHAAVTICPLCQGSMKGTVEKGIDTAIVTDMIKLAWEDSYDIAVLVSGDRDFIPAVELLAAKGRKVVHAGFSPEGMDLARKCWASLDLRQGIQALARPGTPTGTGTVNSQ